MTIREAMRENPQSPYCSICNHDVERCHPNAKAVVCHRCVQGAIHKAAEKEKEKK